MVSLCLGTVQFGLPYGVANAAGQVPPEETQRILERAAVLGVTMLDTAPAYGTSETVLGALGAAGRFRIISKTPQFRGDAIGPEAADAIRRQLETSLATLRADSLQALLVHWPGDLLVPGADHVWRALETARAEGLVRSAGASVYESAELDAIMQRYRIDHVQVPLNVLDQRFIRSGVLSRAKARGIVVHVRSAFLQGLLLMAPDKVPARLAEARPAILALHEAASAAGISSLAVCLGFVAGLEQVDSVVAGVTSLRELEEIAAALADPQAGAIDYPALALDREDLIDPRRWPQ